jgi:hypothetical protein
MSFSSKKTLASLTAGVVIFIAYAVFIFGPKAPETDNLQDWAKIILIFIANGIVLVIIKQILFHIIAAAGMAKEKDYKGKGINKIISSSMVEDERDKLISLKSLRIGYTIAGIGFVAFLFALAFGVKTLYAIHILFGFSGAASFTEGILSIYYYEKGIRNG